jgi:glucose/arabinose dehydrogenase
MKSITFLLMAVMISACGLGNDSTKVKNNAAPPEDNGGITLPSGFKATVFADNLGGARHLVVNKNGVVYVKMESGRNGKGIMRLQDTNGDGVAENVSGFGNYGGTGMAIKNGYLYASSNKEIFRYKLNDKEDVASTDKPEKIVTGLLDHGEHNSKSIILDNAGNIYVNVGAYSNSCQLQNRATGSMGKDPCPILDSAGGIWQFKDDKLNQTYGDGTRYCTGIRNIVGLDWNNSVNQLYAMQHGRDQLHDIFPDMFTTKQSADLPAEEMFRIKQGDDFGWPYCYFDWQQNKKVLAPEYGGDGKKEDRCASKKKPVIGFPGHWAPNGLLFYTGSQFPAKYKNGAFIAFHGSWNRAPEPQAGYFVVFVPFKDGMPSGDYEIFADGFAGGNRDPREARFRPCGLAQGPDGSLYISDDQKGRIWKVNYGK